MTRLLSLLLLTVTLPAFGQSVRMDRLSRTNTVKLDDDIVLNAHTTGTNYVTWRTAISNALNLISTSFAYLTIVGNTNITNINLQGWQIATPHSQWDNTANGPAHTLEFRSGGNASTTDETTGDGFFWMVGNTAQKAMIGFDWLGRIYMSPSNDYNMRLTMLNNRLDLIGNPTLTLCDNTNLKTSLILYRSGPVFKWSNDVSQSFSSVTNLGLFPQFHYSSNGTTSTLTDIYHLLGAVSENVLSTSTVFTNGNIYCMPFFSGAGGNLDSLMVFVNGAVAAGTVTMGLATTVSQTNLLPGNLIFQSGPIDASATGSKITNLVSAVHLNPGQIYYSVLASNTNITVKSIQAPACNQILGWSTNFTQQCMFVAQNATNWNGNVLPSVIPTTNYQFYTFGLGVGARFNGQ